MTESYLLIPAIIIFSVLVIGLIYTVIEFSKMKKDSEKKD